MLQLFWNIKPSHRCSMIILSEFISTVDVWSPDQNVHSWSPLLLGFLVSRMSYSNPSTTFRQLFTQCTINWCKLHYSWRFLIRSKFCHTGIWFWYQNTKLMYVSLTKHVSNTVSCCLFLNHQRSGYLVWNSSYVLDAKWVWALPTNNLSWSNGFWY